MLGLRCWGLSVVAVHGLPIAVASLVAVVSLVAEHGLWGVRASVVVVPTL